MGLFSSILGLIPGVGPVGSGIGAVADMIGGSVLGNYETNRNMNYNQELMNLQHEWQQQENAKDRAWQSEEARLARASAQAYESAEWDRRYEATSPAEQARRLRAAGLNPNSLADSGGTQAISSPAAPSVSASGSHGIGNIAGADAGVLTAGYTNINKLFDSANKLADLAKKTAELPYFKDFIQKQLKMMDVQTDKTLSETHYQEFLNGVNDIIGQNRYADYEMRKIESEINKLRASADLDDEKIVTERTQQFLNEIERWCKSEQFEQMKILTKHYEEQILTKIAYDKAATREAQTRSQTNASQTAVNYQQAHYYRALTQTEDNMREWKVMYQRFAAEGQSEAAQRAWATHSHAIESDLVKLERENLISSKLLQDIRKAEKDNDWYEVSKLIGFAEQISRAALYSSKTGQNIKDMFNPSVDADDAAVMEYLAP